MLCLEELPHCDGHREQGLVPAAARERWPLGLAATCGVPLTVGGRAVEQYHTKSAEVLMQVFTAPGPEIHAEFTLWALSLDE
jgi:hypothetical protein